MDIKKIKIYIDLFPTLYYNKKCREGTHKKIKFKGVVCLWEKNIKKMKKLKII